ncbi:PIN domain-containing protein [Streptomyces sp. NBC_01230]|uniref:PIN domain-containing protein n=1 Tax=Streptomyces sp. NBC_01230 TaxID=2903784 RepID=UPI002E129F26|nr:PIN domain-containing protein [Streptomyces sp. NBC_01230]
MRRQGMMVGKLTVAVDTSAFFSDLAMRNEAWVNTLLRAKRGEIELWVPEVVIQESIRHFTRSLEVALKEMRDGLAKVRALRLDENLFPPRKDLEQSVRAKADGFEDSFRRRLLDSGSRILDLPSISHAELLRRAIAETKPFRHKAQDPGKKGPDGYRDALIWASITEAASHFTKDDTLIFVTDNHKDFCDKDGEGIAADLLTDLPDPRPTVRRLKSLDAMLKYLPQAAVPPEAEQPVVPPEATVPSLDDKILDAVLAACEELLGADVDDGYEERSPGFSFDGISFPGSMETITIESITPDAGTLTWGTYDRFAEDTALATATITADLLFDGFMDKHSYYASDEVDAHDSDWNDHVAWVYVERSAQLTFHVTIQEGTQEVGVTFEGGEAIPTPDH